MSTLTPELQAEIAQHIRESSDIRWGMIFRDMERGLTIEEIAASQPTSLDNARSYVRGTEAMLRGELPTAPSMAVKAARGYGYLLGCNVSPGLRSYVTSCLRQLAAINPEIRVEEPFVPGSAARAWYSCAPGRRGEDCMPDVPHDPCGRLLLKERRSLRSASQERRVLRVSKLRVGDGMAI